MKTQWKQKIVKFIRKNVKFVSGSALTAFLGLSLAGCGGTTALTPTTSTSPTATTTSSSQAVSTTQKKAFLAWAELCQSANLAKYGAMTAIEANKIPVSSYPKIRTALATLSPLCSSYPSNPTVAEGQITSALSDLALAMGQNTINNTAPTTPTLGIQSGVSK